ncbi:MAG: HU family DNA-binding protein [Clostridiales bacterium]|nr:HU family DNA-binding protein [Clostridiales bacterium]
MNRTQLVEALSQKASVSKKAAGELVAAFEDIIKQALEAGDEVRLMGFGTFGTKQSKERVSRNPSNGEMITVPAQTKPYFKFAKSYKVKK